MACINMYVAVYRSNNGRTELDQDNYSDDIQDIFICQLPLLYKYGSPGEGIQNRLT